MPPMIKKTLGFSLIELLAALIVFAILIGYGIPSFSNLRQKLITQTAANQLIHDYQAARHAAIRLQTDVIYCPMDTSATHLIGMKCGKNWTQGSVIFQDSDRNQTIDQSSDILTISPPTKHGLQIAMRAGLNKQYFRILSRGFLENTAGSMIFCSADNEAKHAQVVIFTRNGRMRLGSDKNKDGIPENAEGQAITCPP